MQPFKRPGIRRNERFWKRLGRLRVRFDLRQTFVGTQNEEWRLRRPFSGDHRTRFEGRISRNRPREANDPISSRRRNRTSCQQRPSRGGSNWRDRVRPISQVDRSRGSNRVGAVRELPGSLLIARTRFEEAHTGKQTRLHLQRGLRDGIHEVAAAFESAEHRGREFRSHRRKDHRAGWFVSAERRDERRLDRHALDPLSFRDESGSRCCQGFR